MTPVGFGPGPGLGLRSLRRLVAVLFICLALAHVAAAALVYARARTAAQMSIRTHQSQEIRTELAGLHIALLDAETGQRGFVLTGLEEFLQPYRASAGAIKPRLTHLRALTAGDAAQQQRLAQLAPLLEAKQSLLLHPIELRRLQGFDAARASIAEGHGKEAMDRIRQLLLELDGAEHQNQQRYERAHQQAAVAAGDIASLGFRLGVLLCGLFGLVLIVFLRRFTASLVQRLVAPVAALREAASLSSHTAAELTAHVESQVGHAAELQASVEIVSRMARDLTTLAMEVTTSARVLSEQRERPPRPAPTSSDQMERIEPDSPSEAETERLIRLTARIAQSTLSIDLTLSRQLPLLEEEQRFLTKMLQRAQSAEQVTSQTRQGVQQLKTLAHELGGTLPRRKGLQNVVNVSSGELPPLKV